MNKNFVTGFVLTVALAAAYYCGKKASEKTITTKDSGDEMISKVVESITSFGKKVVDGLKESETYAEKQVKGAEEIKDNCEESWKDYLKEFDKKLDSDLNRMHEKCAEEKTKAKTELSSLEESELFGELDLVKLAADTAANGKKYLEMAVNLAMLEFTDEKAVKYLSTSLEVIPYTDDLTRERIKAAEKLWQSKGRYLEYCKKYEEFIDSWKKAAPSKAREIWEIAKEAKKTVTK